MGVTDFQEQYGVRLSKLEAAFDSLIVQDKPGSKKFGAGRIPFGGASGVLTDDANLVWDNTNKRLGIGAATPSARLTIEGANATYATGPHIEIKTASDAFPLFQQLSWTHDNINLSFDAYFDGSWRSSDPGSNFQLRKLGDQLSTYFNAGTSAGSVLTWIEGLRLNSLGHFFAIGPFQVRDNGFSMPAKTMAHISSSDHYGLRVAASTAGGIQLQGTVATNAGFHRGWLGHNAVWNEADSLWYIDNIGANDATGVFITNGAGFEFIYHATTGASARTMNMTTFRAGAQAFINTNGVNVPSGNFYAVNSTQVIGARVTGWGAPTATLSRTAITNADTLAQTISHLAALVTDLRTHGVIGN